MSVYISKPGMVSDYILLYRYRDTPAATVRAAMRSLGYRACRWEGKPTWIKPGADPTATVTIEDYRDWQATIDRAVTEFKS